MSTGFVIGPQGGKGEKGEQGVKGDTGDLSDDAKAFLNEISTQIAGYRTDCIAAMNSAKSYAESMTTSVTACSESASAAAKSAEAAATSLETIQNKEKDASTYADKAKDYAEKTSSYVEYDTETGSDGSSTLVARYSAKHHALAAANSASAAALSETNAGTSEDNAATSANLAKDFAEKTDGAVMSEITEKEDGTTTATPLYSAKKYALDAEDAAAVAEAARDEVLELGALGLSVVDGQVCQTYITTTEEEAA